MLFISGYSNDAVMRHGAETATVELLQKPFTHLALAQRLRRTLDRARFPDTRGHVLVVDDDPEQRGALAELLADEGYEVSQAAEGGEALEQLRGGGAPDVILLDLQMPRMNGWVFRLEQQNDPKIADIPVIVISGQEDPSGVLDFLHPVECLPKPLDLPRLLDAVSRSCSGRSAAAAGTSGEAS